MLAFDEGGEIVGWATCRPRVVDIGAPRGTLAIVAVDPSRRGEGIGSALAEAADEHLSGSA